MYEDAKKQLTDISAYAGARVDYVQGGGGNISVKFDDTLMGIKASGYTLAEIAPEQGYVTVDYPAIRRYYETVDAQADRDFEAESLKINLDNIRLLPGMESKRPSVEVGFHSFLDRCVIHTHSVYANVLCCSEEGPALAERIFRDTGIATLFVPYVAPGFRLTLAVQQAVDAYRNAHGRQPDAIFLINHGVIVQAGDAETAISLHERVNEAIRSGLSIREFPQPRVRAAGDGYAGDTPYLSETVRALGMDDAALRALKLYPDQLVYIGDKAGDTVRIGTDGVAYRMGEKEAQTVEETLLGVVFVIDTVRRAGLTLRQMREEDAGFIGSWESEKYRAGLVK